MTNQTRIGAQFSVAGVKAQPIEFRIAFVSSFAICLVGALLTLPKRQRKGASARTILDDARSKALAAASATIPATFLGW